MIANPEFQQQQARERQRGRSETLAPAARSFPLVGGLFCVVLLSEARGRTGN